MPFQKQMGSLFLKLDALQTTSGAHPEWPCVDTVLQMLNKSLMSIYYAPSTVAGPWDINTKYWVLSLGCYVTWERSRLWVKVEIHWDKLSELRGDTEERRRWGSVPPDAGVRQGGSGWWKNGKLPWAKERQLWGVAQVPSVYWKQTPTPGPFRCWTEGWGGGERGQAGPRLSWWVTVLHKPPERPNMEVIHISVNSRVRWGTCPGPKIWGATKKLRHRDKEYFNEC